MKVTVNKMELSIFEGAKVKDAVRMYYARRGERLPVPMPVVRDAFGHEAGADGTLLPDMTLCIDDS